MTSGKLPRQDKPSLPSRAFPRPAKARLRGTLPAESTALAVNRDTEALDYFRSGSARCTARPWWPPRAGASREGQSQAGNKTNCPSCLWRYCLLTQDSGAPLLGILVLTQQDSSPLGPHLQALC